MTMKNGISKDKFENIFRANFSVKCFTSDTPSISTLDLLAHWDHIGDIQTWTLRGVLDVFLSCICSSFVSFAKIELSLINILQSGPCIVLGNVHVASVPRLDGCTPD